jgi:hypothetical protein
MNSKVDFVPPWPLRRQICAQRLETIAGVWDFPAIFEDFKGQKCTLLWRGSRNGFDGKEFHRRCDGHPNTLTLVLDAQGNVFGYFIPVE